GQVVAEAGDDAAGDLLDEFGGGPGDGRRHLELAGGFGRDLDFVDVLQGFVDGGVVHGDDLVARFAVALLDGALDFFKRGGQRDDVGDLEEGGLHDDVDARAQSQLFAQFDGVDDVEFEFLVDDLLLDFLGHLVPDFTMPEGGAEQEGAARFGLADHVVFLQEGEVVTGDEVGVVDQVGGVDGLFPETQVRDGDGAGLFGVVDEIGLGKVLGGFADDLDGVLVGADGAVGAETEEHGFVGAIHGGAEGWRVLQAAVGDVFLDADHEVVLRFGFFQVVQDRFGHGRGEFLGTQAVAAADDDGIAFEAEFAGCHGFADGGAHIKIERFAQGAGLFGAVEDGDALDGLGQGLDEGVQREGTIEVDFDDADLLALFDESFHRFFDGIGGGT